MLCTCPSGKNEPNYQPLPSSGPLKQMSNYRLERLKARIKSQNFLAPIYCYIMTSIQNGDNTLQHIGSGPNWQGGIITLCTCKHLMRTFRTIEDWPGTWVAGFSNIRAGDGKNVLIYLMRVEHAFESHYDLWHALPSRVRLAKATDTNTLGDVYKPLGADTQEDPFNICRYHQPHPSHKRKYEMIKDINYRRNDNHRAALLVGDVKYSFIWDQCKITFKDNIGRGQRKLTLGEFLGLLREAKQRKQ